MKIFLICPVRNYPGGYGIANAIVKDSEVAGDEIYYPPRDTDQDDPLGLRICQDNLTAMKECDMVYIVWDGKSQGCLFDFGMAFALGKPIKVIACPEFTETKSFQNAMLACQKET